MAAPEDGQKAVREWIARRLQEDSYVLGLEWAAVLNKSGCTAGVTEQEIARGRAVLQEAWTQYFQQCASADLDVPKGCGTDRFPFVDWDVDTIGCALLALRDVCAGHLTAVARRSNFAAENEVAAIFGCLADRFVGGVLERVLGAARGRVRNGAPGELLERLTAAQEEERKRLAREIHDHTGQWLTSLLLGLRRLASEDLADPQREAVLDLCECAEKALEELHQLIHELRPGALSEGGLAAALQRYAADFALRTGVRVVVDVGALEGICLSEAVEVALYRIVQEALTNVAKHARARNVSLLAQYRHNTLRLMVEDDGCGYVAGDGEAQDSKHFGLMGMQERATLAGGRLTIESSPGAGTTVCVDLPV